VRAHHVGVTVSDLARSVAFYGGLFGAEPEIARIYDAPYTSEQVGYPGAVLDIAIFRIPDSDLRLELIQYLNPVGTTIDVETKNPGVWHLCLETASIADDFARMVTLGGVPRSPEPVLITSGPNIGKRVAYIRDLDGLTIELIERIPATQGGDT
jgi:catechol 2,3-dioxygenase-like lactoylglutathione lyase family enzyme